MRCSTGHFPRVRKVQQKMVSETDTGRSRRMKTAAKVIGYGAIAFAAVAFFFGDIGQCFILILAGAVLLWSSSRMGAPSARRVQPPPAAPAPPPDEPEMSAREKIAAAWDEMPPSPLETKASRQKRQAKERKQQAAAEGVACCPRCGSTSLSLNKNGFGGGKATAGMLAVGLGGAVAGTYGMNKMKITCLNCGYKYKPGKKTRV